MDLPTFTSNLAVADLASYMRSQQNINVDYLWGVGSNRWAFNNYMKRHKYNAVFYFGHGTEKGLKGTHFVGNIIDKNNAHFLKDTMVISMACLAGKQLGYDIVSAGAKCFVGFTDLYYAAFIEKERNFFIDWKDYTLSYFKAILEGKNAHEAHETFVRNCNKYIKLYEPFKKNKNFDWYSESVLHNRNIMIVLGSSKTTL